MDPAQWERVKEIIERASELPLDQVEAFVEQACAGDAVLAREAQSLLRYATRLQAIRAGSILSGRYRLVRRIGAGAFGVTWLAEDSALYDRRVVVKVPTSFSAADPWIEAKFFEEIQALAALNHPGVVVPLAIGRLDDQTPFLVMEYVEGRTLRELIDDTPPSWIRVGHILRQIGRALQAVSEAGIYHRDLKPGNIMVQTLPDGSDHVRLIDFGIATIRAHQPGPQGSAIETRIVGSPGYMAPEQFEGRVTPTTDTYAFAAIATELLAASQTNRTGRAPAGLSGARDMSTTQHLAGLPRHLATLLRRGLADSPGDRPTDTAAYADDIAAALTPTSASRRASFLATGAAAVALVSLLLVVWRPGVGDERLGESPPTTGDVVPGATNAVPDISVELLKDSPDGLRDISASAVTVNVRDRLRLRVVPSAPGHLYLFSESEDGLFLNTLFPSPTANGGLSGLAGSQALEIPENDWLVFDRAGRDRLWMVWSTTPHPLLESAKAWANDRDRGTVRDPVEKTKVKELLAATTNRMSIVSGRLVMTGNDPLMAGVIDIRHE
jgi:serine/threonine protein kinase